MFGQTVKARVKRVSELQDADLGGLPDVHGIPASLRGNILAYQGSVGELLRCWQCDWIAPRPWSPWLLI